MKKIWSLALPIIVLALILQNAAFAAAISGTGCVTGGDCVALNASQIIDSGGVYYFNSFTLPAGATIIVAGVDGGVTTGNGGSVRIYAKTDANISGSISAGGYGNAYSGTAGEGGYRGGPYSGGNYGGYGGGFVQIGADTIRLSGQISAPGFIGNGEAGGGSGGTIRLFARRLVFNGTITANGGAGADLKGGGGAAGSVVIVPLEVAYLAGQINVYAGAGTSSMCNLVNNGGRTGGGSGQAGGAGGPSDPCWGVTGGGGAGSGGDGSMPTAGIANPDRNVKIFNSVAVPGFSLVSSGSPAGLLDLYNTPSSSAFASMAVTTRPENLIVSSR